MANLKIGYLRLIARLDQGFEGCLYQGRDTTAEHHLLAEEVGLCLFCEGGLQDPSLGAANALGISQSYSLRLS